MGVSPVTQIRVADSSEQELHPDPGICADQFLTDALSNRPDVIAAFGKIRAAQATLEKEQAEYRPTIQLAAQLYQNMGSLSSQGDQWDNVDKPGGSILLQFSWPLFDAGRRQRQIDIARADVDAAGDTLNQARNMAVKEVTDAYYTLKTALAEYAAAKALTDAAQTAHDAGLDAYQNGIGTFTSLQNDANALVQAQTKMDCPRGRPHGCAALAFATGSITSR